MAKIDHTMEAILDKRTGDYYDARRHQFVCVAFFAGHPHGPPPCVVGYYRADLCEEAQQLASNLIWETLLTEVGGAS